MELRKDYVLNQWVIISQRRGERPKEFKEEKLPIVTKVCFFCPGNEHLTPPEIMRVGLAGDWRIRVFPNKFPFVQQEGYPVIQTHNNYYTFASGWGEHEVVVETPDHERQLWDLSAEHIADVLAVYTQRVRALYQHEHVQYVSVFKNHGAKAGTSLIHTHTQIATTNLVPPRVADEMACSVRDGLCHYCRVLQSEPRSQRRCFENEHFCAFTPYASRFNYEIWIFSKAHKCRLADLNGTERMALAQIMQRVLLKLKELGVSYNFHLHEAPPGQDLHFHIEFSPRLATYGGFELCTDIIINSVSPEEAASFFRS